MTIRRFSSLALVFALGISVGKAMQIPPRTSSAAPEPDQAVCKIPEHISVWRDSSGPIISLVPYAWAGDGRQKLMSQKSDDQDLWFVSFDCGRVVLSCIKQ